VTFFTQYTGTNHRVGTPGTVLGVLYVHHGLGIRWVSCRVLKVDPKVTHLIYISCPEETIRRRNKHAHFKREFKHIIFISEQSKKLYSQCPVPLVLRMDSSRIYTSGCACVSGSKIN